MDAIGGLVVVGLLIVAYFIPTIIAISRKKRNDGAILILNLFLGWTLIGWVVALVWAVAYESPQESKRPKQDL